MSSGNVESEKGPTAILNHREREMLTEDVEVSDQVRWKRHERIRERLKWALYDFALLGGHNHENWDELNLDKVFNEQNLSHPRVRDGATGMFYVLYRGLFGDYMPAFENHLQDGISLAEIHMNNRHVYPSLTIDRPEYGNVIVDSALARITPEDVDTLRISEMRAVLNKIAESNVDVAELIWEEQDGEPLFGQGED